MHSNRIGLGPPFCWEKGVAYSSNYILSTKKMFTKKIPRKGKSVPVVQSLVFALLGFMTFPLAAQTAKGSWLMGGNAYIRYQVDDGRNRWNTELNPSVGYFVGKPGPALPLAPLSTGSM
jgi:hypothetical protein